MGRDCVRDVEGETPGWERVKVWNDVNRFACHSGRPGWLQQMDAYMPAHDCLCVWRLGWVCVGGKECA
jgi:hypothetical protein